MQNQLDGIDPVPVPLTKDRWAELEKMNNDVNRAIKPEENLGGVMAEQWLVAPRQGDCNDYAVDQASRVTCPRLAFALVAADRGCRCFGRNHLVLVVRTSEDDLVLDNLSANVRPVSQIAYELVRAQQMEIRILVNHQYRARYRVAMNSR